MVNEDYLLYLYHLSLIFKETHTMTPRKAVDYIRDNQNNNKTLKSLFATQFLGKFDSQELEGMAKSISKEMGKREQKTLQDKINYLEANGYNVSR